MMPVIPNQTAMPTGQLPAVPQRMNPIFGNPALGSLPSIPGFDPSRMPTMNPLGGEHLFFQSVNPTTGQVEGPSLANPGQYTNPTAGNPLYYGRTGSYTGPQGPTDTAMPPPPPPAVQPAEQPAGITFEDALQFTFGLPGSNPNAESYNNVMNIDKMKSQFQKDFGFNMSDAFDPTNEGWKKAVGQFQMDSQQDRSK